MPLTTERYAQVFPPSPDYILLKRFARRDEMLGMIVKPQNVAEAQARFTTVAKILAISRFEPLDLESQRMWKIIQENNLKYVGFSIHAPAEVCLMEEFRLPKEDEGLIILMNLRDVVQLPEGLDQLMEDFEKYQIEMKAKEEQEIKGKQDIPSLEDLRAKMAEERRIHGA